MKETLGTKNSNNRIFILLTVLGLSVILMSGCQQVNNMVNGNTTTANSNAEANTNSSANSNAAANSNANANTSSVLPINSAANANTQASNTAANTATVTKEGVPLTAEEKVFANQLIGTWSDDNEKVVFSKDEIKFFDKSGNPGFTWKYTIVDEKSVEITDEEGQKSTATMAFEDNNTTLIWKDKVGDFKYKREAAKP